MCAVIPLAIAAFGLNAASDVVQAKAQNSAAAANTAAANVNQSGELNSLSLRGVQEQQAANTNEQEAARKTDIDTALQNLGAAENGVSGNSVEALTSELQAQKGRYNDSVAENLHNQLLQIQQDKSGVIAHTQAQINSVPKANPFATALRIGGAALSTFTQISGQSPSVGGDQIAPSASPLRIPMVNTPNLAPTNLPMAPVAANPALNLRIGTP